MGGKQTKQESEINSTGQINNNVIVQEHVDIIKDSRILLCISIGLKMFEIVYIIYRDHIRGKKKQAVRNEATDKARSSHVSTGIMKLKIVFSSKSIDNSLCAQNQTPISEQKLFDIKIFHSLYK